MTDLGDSEFGCTPGGAIAASQRRLAALLAGLATLLLLAALAAWVGGRVWAGVIALLVAMVVGLAWRMSQDSRPRKLRLEEQTLLIETPSRLIQVSIADATIRPLDTQEIHHLELLASNGGFVAGSGGFDSKRLGEFDLYASDFANALFIQSLEGRVVVTPDRRADFLEAVRKRTASPATIPSP